MWDGMKNGAAVVAGSVVDRGTAVPVLEGRYDAGGCRSHSPMPDSPSLVKAVLTMGAWLICLVSEGVGLNLNPSL